MKLIMFNVNGTQKTLAENWAKDNQVAVTLVDVRLDKENVHLAEGFDGVVNSEASHKVDDEVYSALHRYGIRQIAQVSAGYDYYDLDLAAKNELIITNVPSYSPESIAEYTVLAALNLVRKNHVIFSNVAKHDFSWSNNIRGGVMGKKKVAVIGTGRIGQFVARYFHGFGCEVIGYDIYQNEQIKEILTYRNSIEEAISEADIVSIHIPATKENEHLFDYQLFKKFKPGAVFLNMARGSIVDTNALLQALDEGILAGAGIDTYEAESPYVCIDHTGKEISDKIFLRLISHPNVMYSPHIAYFTDEAVKNLIEGGLNAAVEVITTGTSKNRVN